MANISQLPVTLRELGRQMPDGLLGKLHQGEAENRIKDVRDSMEAAEALPAEQYRQVTARARRQLRAMPYGEFVQERKRLEGLRSDARNAGRHDIADAWADALNRLSDEHPQVAGVGEAIMKWDKEHPVSKASREARQVALVQ